MGTYDAIRNLGLSIPKDVAVMGIDNIEIIASQPHAALTTMQLSYYELGQWAVRQLIEQLGKDKDDQPAQVMMDCPLIERQSI
jgi:LacI family transcriptional regulator